MSGWISEQHQAARGWSAGEKARAPKADVTHRGRKDSHVGVALPDSERGIPWLNQPGQALPSAIYPSVKLTVVQSSLQGGQQTARQKEDGELDVPQVLVDVVYFDSQGELIGTGVTFVQNLKSGDTASFKASTPKTQAAHTETYAVPDHID